MTRSTTRGAARLRGELPAVLITTACAVAMAAGPAAATTGDGTGLPVPKQKIKPQIADRFAGRFFLSQIPRKASIISGQLDMDYTDTETSFFVGTIELIAANSTGARVSIVGNVYPIEYTHGRLTGNLLISGTDNQVFGRLSFAVPTGKSGPKQLSLPSISGELTLEHQRYAVSFNRGSDDGPPPRPLPVARRVG